MRSRGVSNMVGIVTCVVAISTGLVNKRIEKESFLRRTSFFFSCSFALYKSVHIPSYNLSILLLHCNHHSKAFTHKNSSKSTRSCPVLAKYPAIDRHPTCHHSSKATSIYRAQNTNILTKQLPGTIRLSLLELIRYYRTSYHRSIHLVVFRPRS